MTMVGGSSSAGVDALRSRLTCVGGGFSSLRGRRNWLMAPSSATQLAKARAPFRACQAKQQRSRTQSCTGSLFCLPGEAATHLASAAVIKHDWIVKQQNAVLHGLLVLLARQSSNAATQSCTVALSLARGGSNTVGKGTAGTAATQLAKARAPFRACQARQQRSKQQRSKQQRSRAQS